MIDPLLRVRHLSAGFEKHVVFRRVEFDVPRIGAWGILGPSGVGKSTLLRTLGRWNDLRPSFWVHGEIDWRGRDVLREIDRSEANERFALLQQKARLYTSSILENAVAGLSEEGELTVRDKCDLAQTVLSPFGLWDSLRSRLSQPVTSLPLTEQRMLTLARLVATGAEAILADEPTRDLEEGLSLRLIRMMEELKERLALILVTHNQIFARNLLDHVLLITGGTLVESSPAQRFFRDPETELGRRYLQSGNCWPTREEMDPDWVRHRDSIYDELDAPRSAEPLSSDRADSSKRPSWIPTALESMPRPGGFHWIEPGLLGGMQWPGLLKEVDADLDGLVALGIRHLVNLTETPFPSERLGDRRIELKHFPIADMKVPDLDACRALCEEVETWLERGEATVFHCRAGLGRTGTLLACMRILRGRSAVNAIDDVRRVNSMYIQSDEQLDFVNRFSREAHVNTSHHP